MSDRKHAFVVAHPPREEDETIKHFEAKNIHGEVIHKAETEKEAAKGAIEKGFKAHIVKDRKAHKHAVKPENFKVFVEKDHEEELKLGKRPHKAGDKHHENFHHR
ncbi:hypothetical protein FAI41_02395 [Acetobacteraceae bacterium]|nr:hypothetical protein FAI41_02395 [Acetobacteraceae bacterium]